MFLEKRKQLSYCVMYTLVKWKTHRIHLFIRYAFLGTTLQTAPQPKAGLDIRYQLPLLKRRPPLSSSFFHAFTCIQKELLFTALDSLHSRHRTITTTTTQGGG